MEKLNMKYDRLKEILDICDLSELDSIDLLLGYVKKYDLKLINSVFTNLYQQKWDKYNDEFEGINEYDYITRINNFDIEKILDSIELNSYELIFFKKIMEDALITIKNNKNPLDLKIMPNLEKALQNVNNRLNYLGDLSELTDINVLDTYDYHDELSYDDYDTGINDLDKLYASNEKITEEELENMFQKFDAVEIEEFDNIFEHIETYNIETIMDISNKVKNEKVKNEKVKNEKVKNEKVNNEFKEFDVFDRPYNYNIGSLYCKKDILSEKELKLLCILLKDAILNYEEHDDFKASLFNLMESYIEELDKRKEISEKAIVGQNIKEESSSSSKRDLFLESLRVSPEELANNKKCQKEKQEQENENENENENDQKEK